MARTSIKKFAISLVTDNLEAEPASNVGPWPFQIPGSFSTDRAQAVTREAAAKDANSPREIVEAAEIDGCGQEPPRFHMQI
ncbi:hypothetical protein SAMN05216228_100655 [Rhizobium tibeticum]|uniref:Uncharacterized protein n=1 Tax=Rhizobium tibeticum TaxID=501024 RepID=A0A1H8IAC9_9HYPH|nr:hypothetical protein RTCCBAU85039_1844 [Rhizobium tibeticum]SEN65105.1 hypothetical protein SAMN05216228_100655 [Rhizobium tibeticum]